MLILNIDATKLQTQNIKPQLNGKTQTFANRNKLKY